MTDWPAVFDHRQLLHPRRPRQNSSDPPARTARPSPCSSFIVASSEPRTICQILESLQSQHGDTETLRAARRRCSLRGQRVSARAPCWNSSCLRALRGFVPFFCEILAQVSRSDTVRLKTSAAGRRIGVDAEVAEALELVARARPGALARLGSTFARRCTSSEFGFRCSRKLSVACRIFVREQPIVNPHFGVERVRRRHPVQRRLHLAAVRRIAAACRRIVGRAQLGNLAGGRILDDARALDEVRAPQPHFVAGRQPEELLRRVLHEVVALDVELAAERHLARARRRILRIVDDVDLFRSALRDSSR